MSTEEAKMTRYEKELPVRESYDVIVCGGGPAGIGAAVAAADSWAAWRRRATSIP